MKFQNFASTWVSNSSLAYVAHALTILVLFVFAQPSFAGPGHDHGDQSSNQPTVASPRVVSQSELFELVAIAESDRLVIYLDQYATNTPITNARIEIESGTTKAVVPPETDGTYVFKTDLFSKPGSFPISFTIISGQQSDLLAGDLLIPQHAANDDHSHGTSDIIKSKFFVVALIFFFLTVPLWLIVRKVRMARSRSKLSQMAIVFLASSTLLTSAEAGPGHDHSDSAPTALSNAPKRQSDGTIFLPKVSQRLLAIRTNTVDWIETSRTIELVGKVIADPTASGKVQATQAGRIEVGAASLPSLGQIVKKGQPLVTVRSAVGAIERANQVAAGLEAKGQLELAKKRLARLEQLEGSVPQKDIESARAELQSYLQRSKAIAGSATATETLTAPISGTIAAVNVVVGQVVDAREILFEIIDSSKLMVEANAFDPDIILNVDAASALLGKTNTSLQYVGTGKVLRESAIPILFRLQSADKSAFVVGQVAKVFLKSKQKLKGFVVSAGSLVKSTSNQDMVWVHTDAESFVPRVVRYTNLDGVNVAILDGLKNGDRVVTQGAALLSQVR
jgi:membrane fusion protein, heavy metal efflux system